MSLETIKNVKKIAILRANGLGDFIVTLPAIKAIKEAYPTAEISLLGKPWHATFLQAKRTPIDRVIVVPVYPGIREEKGILPDEEEIASFFNQVNKERFDIAIHFQGKGVASNSFIKKLNARITVGHTSAGAAAIDYAVPYFYYQNEAVRYLELTRLIGANTGTLEPKIRLLDEDREEAQRILRRFEIREPFIVLHAGATDIRRRWPLQKFAQLGDLLAQKGYTIVLTGDEDDQGIIHTILQHMVVKATNLCNLLSLGGLGALLAASTLVVSNDTGPLHLARAVGAKTVGIYWAPNLINWGPLTRSNHRPVISWNMQCPKCGIIPNTPFPFEPKLANCAHLFSFVNDIAVEEVMAQIDILLTLSPQRTITIPSFQQEQ